MNVKTELDDILQECSRDLSANDRKYVVNMAAAAHLLSAGTHTTPNGSVIPLAPEGAAIWELSESKDADLAGSVIRNYSTCERAMAGADERAGRFVQDAGPWQKRGWIAAYEDHPAEYVRTVPGIGVQRIQPTFLDDLS